MDLDDEELAVTRRDNGADTYINYRERIQEKIEELEADPKYGHQTWFDEDVVNMLYELIEE